MEVTAQIVSLLDPLSGDRIVIPVKGPNCAHPNIWDKENWSQYGASVSWKCLFCQKEAKMDAHNSLQRIIERLSASVTEVKLENGRWVEESSSPARKNILDISPKPVIRFREPQKAFDISGGQTREYTPVGQTSNSPSNLQHRSGVIDISNSNNSSTASTPRASVDLTQRKNPPSHTAPSSGFEVISRSSSSRVHSQSSPVYVYVTSTPPPSNLATMPSFPIEVVNITPPLQLSGSAASPPPRLANAEVADLASNRVSVSIAPVACFCKSHNKKAPLPDCVNCGKTIKKGYHACPNKNLCSKCYRRRRIFEEETTSGWKEIDGKCSIQ